MLVRDQNPGTHPVTVQVKEDGVLTFCTHAGATSRTLTFNQGLDDEYETLATVCDKSNCNAYTVDGEEWINE